MTPRRVGWVALVIAAALGGAATAGPANSGTTAGAKPAAASPAPSGEAPPAQLLSGPAARGAALDPVFAHFQLQRLACAFREEKRIALLARPLTSSGAIYFDRERGIARNQTAPRPQQAVLTKTSLRLTKDGRTEDIPLDKSKDLKAFALIFPSLLRGERAELEKAFDLALYGSEPAWWALAFTPRTESLRALVRRVVVFGRGADVVSLQVAEASGDTTETRLTGVKKNGDVTDAEIAAAFGSPGVK
jgi:hypothetical protein